MKQNICAVGTFLHNSSRAGAGSVRARCILPTSPERKRGLSCTIRLNGLAARTGPAVPQSSSSSSSSSDLAAHRNAFDKKKRFNKWTVVLFGLMCVGFAIERASDSNSGLLGLGTERVLDPLDFNKFTVVSKEALSPTLSIFILEPTHGKKDDNEAAYASFANQGVWSVEFKQPQLQIARRYTPLPPSSEATQGVGALSFVIRREHAGEVSRYLHTLPRGSEIEVRGGYTEYALPKDIEEVVFLAGGTGIAPALQVAHALKLRAKEQDTRINMHILWANRTQEECKGGIAAVPATSQGKSWLSGLWGGKRSPDVDTVLLDGLEQSGALVKRLQALGANDPSMSSSGLNLKVSYFVDEQGSFIKQDSIASALKSNHEAGVPKDSSKKLILVSGPDGFVEYTAGAKKIWRGVESQGPVGGLLAKTKISGWTLHKL